MAKCKKAQKCPDGLPDWLLTFADLMSLLVCFFVLIISFSIQDKEKLQVVAGSMRDAFGVKDATRKAGMIEIEGAPMRQYIKSVTIISDSTKDSDFDAIRQDERSKQGPEANTHDIEENKIKQTRQFALAAASLRQAFEEMPEILEVSDNIMIEDTPEGLHIQLVDQDGRSMFPQGSSKPYERTRRLLAKMVPVLRKLPNRIAITGHTDATRLYGRSDYSLWDLSADRARASRKIMAAAGMPHDQFFSISGKADSDPLFPEDPFLAANRRISILVMAEAPPMPADMTP
ncbi:MAG: flagellar motor protein MotB [Hyphomicrobiaceae bacterium]|nr:flagellar motor protein MotB [Hyphomicrobiaceae bacterium]